MKQAIFITDNDQLNTTFFYYVITSWMNNRYYKQAMAALPSQYPGYEWTQGQLGALRDHAYDLVVLSRNAIAFRNVVKREYPDTEIIDYKPAK